MSWPDFPLLRNVYGRRVSVWAMGIALLSGVVIVARDRTGRSDIGISGIVVIDARSEAGVTASPPQRPAVYSSPTAPLPSAAQSAASGKSFGEPTMASDPMLDGIVDAAPEEIGVRHRLFSMQWAAAPAAAAAAAAERAWAARLTQLGGMADRIRVRCSETTCEIATDDPAVAPRLAALATPWEDRDISCPLVAPDAAKPTWTMGSIGIIYAPRPVC